MTCHLVIEMLDNTLYMLVSFHEHCDNGFTVVEIVKGGDPFRPAANLLFFFLFHRSSSCHRPDSGQKLQPRCHLSSNPRG